MPDNIIDLDRHRKAKPDKDEFDLIERMSMIEDALELLDELGVSSRDELTRMLEELESSMTDAPD